MSNRIQLVCSPNNVEELDIIIDNAAAIPPVDSTIELHYGICKVLSQRYSFAPDGSVRVYVSVNKIATSMRKIGIGPKPRRN